MRKKIGIVFLFGLILFLISFYFILFYQIPGSFSLIKGEETFLFEFPFNLSINGERDISLEINGRTINDIDDISLNPGNGLKVKANQIGKVSMDLKLFGIFPFKSITVNVLPEIKVFPGGQAIGVLLRSKGVMVVGKSFVESKNGHRYYPAREAGIEVGDTILEINGSEINDKLKLASNIQKIAEQGLPLSLKIKTQQGKLRVVNLKAVENKQGIYMIGLYVDDGVAGVGTLTFYETEKKEYGALGHEITEANSNNRIEVREGKIIEAKISGINSGKKGLPGEKLGTFFQTDNVIGDIVTNNKFGIYGNLHTIPNNPYFSEPVPVAAISQVKTGPAKMYTVVNDGVIEEFDVNIERIYQQSYPGDKGLIISIIDQRLKEMTGGIIQGMSGSPIVQNGRMVGAVTHVFVNEPTKGYGVFAEWMLLQTGIYEMNRASNF
ncbi:MAG: SpoIVB peptidase [Firmicutes bacterium]|nr:SpoIVB peptidase [Bacillota bacterium]